MNNQRPDYRPENVFVFNSLWTNRDARNGKKCHVVNTMPRGYWLRGSVPAYTVVFIDSGEKLVAYKKELTPVKE